MPTHAENLQYAGSAILLVKTWPQIWTSVRLQRNDELLAKKSTSSPFSFICWAYALILAQTAYFEYPQYLTAVQALQHLDGVLHFILIYILLRPHLSFGHNAILVSSLMIGYFLIFGLVVIDDDEFGGGSYRVFLSGSIISGVGYIQQVITVMCRRTAFGICAYFQAIDAIGNIMMVATYGIYAHGSYTELCKNYSQRNGNYCNVTDARLAFYVVPVVGQVLITAAAWYYGRLAPGTIIPPGPLPLVPPVVAAAGAAAVPVPVAVTNGIAGMDADAADALNENGINDNNDGEAIPLATAVAIEAPSAEVPMNDNNHMNNGTNVDHISHPLTASHVSLTIHDTPNSSAPQLLHDPHHQYRSDKTANDMVAASENVPLMVPSSVVPVVIATLVDGSAMMISSRPHHDAANDNNGSSDALSVNGDIQMSPTTSSLSSSDAHIGDPTNDVSPAASNAIANTFVNTTVPVHPPA